MERRHQVFISSTFADLKDERAEIIQAILELDCIPSGMELFPATNDGAWELIKRVIDDSDYYCLVIGGRYGSLDEEGLSFTEKEYNYAVSKRKPLMAFLHAKPQEIPVGKSEKSEAGIELLNSFRSKVEDRHHCKYWSSASELGGQVSRSLISLRKSHPADGWVPGRFAADEAMRIELANLRAKNAELTVEIESRKVDGFGVDDEGLSQGSDRIVFPVSYALESDGALHSSEATVTWDDILKYVGPALLPECSDKDFQEKLDLCFLHAVREQASDAEDTHYVIIPYVVVDQIKVQLRALGYMIPGTKRRAVSDNQSYWKLTRSGESRLLSVQAFRRRDRKDAPKEAIAISGGKTPETNP